MAQGGGGTLIFSYIPRLRLFFWFKILNSNIFGGFQKILWIFLGGYDKIGLYLEVISMHFRVFSDVQGTEWRIFLGLLKINFNYLFRVLESHDIFFWGGGGGGGAGGKW